MPTYSSISKAFRTGDIILFNFSDTFSNNTERRTKSKFSHVGMIVRFPEINEKEPLLWHSAPGTRDFAVSLYNDEARNFISHPPNNPDTNNEKTSDEDIQKLLASFRYLSAAKEKLEEYTMEPDTPEEKTTQLNTDDKILFTTTPHNSVSNTATTARERDTLQELCLHGVKLERLVPHLKMLSALNHLNDGDNNTVKCAYQKINYEIQSNEMELLKTFIRENDDKPFPYPAKKLWDEYALGQEGKESDTNSYYCGEIIAATYMSMGLLQKSKPANAYMPTHFSSEHPETPFLSGISFDQEIWFDIDTV